MLFRIGKKTVSDLQRNRLPDALRQAITGYIEENYRVISAPVTYGVSRMEGSARQRRKMEVCQEDAMPAPCMAAATLEDMLKQQDAGFTQTLLQLIDRTGKKDSEIYKKANLSKQHFSKIRNDPQYKPKKTTALALAIALELDLEQTRDLIGRAGYALTNSSKLDLIVRFFIEQRIFDVLQINIALYEFDQVLLGS